MLIELALATALQQELGANAPDSLVPCKDERPKRIENAKPRPKPKVGLVHKHVLKTKKLPAIDCDEGALPGPLAVMFPPIENLEYTPAPEQETFAAAPEPTIGREAGTDEPYPVSPAGDSFAGAAAFTSFGGGGTFGGYSAIGGPCCAPGGPIPFVAAPVPEPSTWAFLGLGLLSLAGLGRKT